MSIQSPQPADLPRLTRIAENAGVFSAAELQAMREMFQAFFAPGLDDDHELVIYRNGTPESVVGFVCFGPTPFTDRVWDVYWICVDRTQQGKGIGSQLLQYVEEHLRARGARALYLETSDSPAYTPARRLYEHHGYERVAYLEDFYARGEGKVIYRKVLQH